MKLIRRLSLGFLSGVALVLTGLGYEAVATHRDDKRFPGPGQRIDVDGLRMHARVLGTEHQQGPTVVFESGLATPLEGWSRIQPEVAKIARTISYDRAGMGWSQATALPRTAKQLNRELAKLLSALDCPVPYVLVGHSYGGLLVRCFADRFPDTVAGLVLLDSAHPEQFRRSTAQRLGLPMLRSLVGQDAFWASCGLTRLVTKKRVSEQLKDLPAPALGSAIARLRSARNFRGTRSELAGWLDHVNAETLDTLVPEGCRLSLVTAGKVADADSAHATLQRELATLTEGSRHEILPDAEHTELLTHPGHAPMVAQVIQDMVIEVRDVTSRQHPEPRRTELTDHERSAQ